jgi:hypothetical protein
LYNGTRPETKAFYLSGARLIHLPASVVAIELRRTTTIRPIEMRSCQCRPRIFATPIIEANGSFLAISEVFANHKGFFMNMNEQNPFASA